ncbi:MAG: ATP-dependent helicase, partial [Candidatus Dormibacterales bacterium]
MTFPPALTEEQRAAAHAGPEGAFLIEAGPGTGKTFTMAERFVWLVREQGVPCDRVLTVTFTERAAQELRARITERLRPSAESAELAAMDSAWIGTFHAVCARLLTEHAYQFGAAREMRVLDEAGQRLLLDSLKSRLRSGEAGGVDQDRLQALGPEDVSDLLRRGLDFVLKLKGRGIGKDDFREGALRVQGGPRGPDVPAALADRAEAEAVFVLHAVYAAYEEALAAGGLLDFDDLILRVVAALDRSPELVRWCRDRFRYIVVDEFQDTNHIQFELVRRLAAPDFGNVAVVGDAKQSIYGWRDAEVENIRSRFPGRRLPLTRNRRSVAEILDCATSLMRRDPDFSAEPDLVAERGAGGAAVTVMMAASAAEEAGMVAAEVGRLREAGMPLAEIALLTHSVRRLPLEFEQALREHGLPYVTSGGAGFFDREEVKDVVALLRLAEDPLDDGALVRVLQGPVVRLDDAGMYEVGRRRLGRRGMRLRDCWEESGADGHPGLGAGPKARAARVLAAVDAASGERGAMTVAEVLGRLLDTTGYLRYVQARSRAEGPRALRNLRQLVTLAGRLEK